MGESKGIFAGYGPTVHSCCSLHLLLLQNWPEYIQVAKLHLVEI